MIQLKIGFGQFLEEDEKVHHVFRTPVLFMLFRVLINVAIWGGMAYGVWYFFRSYNAHDLTLIWQTAVAWAAYKILGSFFHWYYNAIIMTNESLLFIDWKKLFHRNFARIDFHNLDEIEVEKKGLRSFAWNYGTLRFQKVNGGGEIVVPHMNRPSYCARVIERYRESMIDHKNFTEESALKGLLSQMVQRHVGENGQPDRELEEAIDKVQGKGNTNTPSVPLFEKAGEEPTRQKKSFFEKIKERNKPKPQKERHFESMSIEVEKELDDDGGIEFDLDR